MIQRQQVPLEQVSDVGVRIAQVNAPDQVQTCILYNEKGESVGRHQPSDLTQIPAQHRDIIRTVDCLQ
jgi:hypothetical protein